MLLSLKFVLIYCLWYLYRIYQKCSLFWYKRKGRNQLKVATPLFQSYLRVNNPIWQMLLHLRSLRTYCVLIVERQTTQLISVLFFMDFHQDLGKISLNRLLKTMEHLNLLILLMIVPQIWLKRLQVLSLLQHKLCLLMITVNSWLLRCKVSLLLPLFSFSRTTISTTTNSFSSIFRYNSIPSFYYQYIHTTSCLAFGYRGYSSCILQSISL